ncbi:hypothetical protein EJB05_31393, partial [Eragrostis curvula]
MLSGGLGSIAQRGPWNRGTITHLPDGDIVNGSATWSTVAEVARPPRGGVLYEAARVSNGGCGEAPACCVLVVMTARRPACGPDPVVSPCRMRHYGGRSRIAVAFSVQCGLFFSVIPIAMGLCLAGDFMDWKSSPDDGTDTSMRVLKVDSEFWKVKKIVETHGYTAVIIIANT